MTFYFSTDLSNSQPLNCGRGNIRIAIYLMSDIILSIEVERSATAQQILNIIQSDGDLGLARTPPVHGQPVFALWLCSAQLEVQLRPTHKPLDVAAKWPRLILKYGSQDVKDKKEPILCLRRNVFLSRKDEEQIKEPKILELLYAEAKQNVLNGTTTFFFFFFFFFFFLIENNLNCFSFRSISM